MRESLLQRDFNKWHCDFTRYFGTDFYWEYHTGDTGR